MASSVSAIALGTASMLRLAARRMKCLSLANNCSIGLRSVGWQEEEPCTCGLDDAANGRALMGAEIVEHDDVARFQGLDEFGFDIEAEGLAVDGSIEHPRRIDAIMRSAAMKVTVFQWPYGVGDVAASAPATQRAMLVFTLVRRWRPAVLDQWF